MSALVNTIQLFCVGVGGLLSGFYLVEQFGGSSQETDQSVNHEELDISVNTAILYLTVALVLSTVVIEWPPEGQRMLSGLEDPIFFGTVLIAAMIIGRVTRLIWKVETQRMA